MLTEQGRVISVELDALWVETTQQSTCGRCVAQKGCGQKLLAKAGSTSTHLRVLTQQENSQAYKVGDTVTLAIPNDIIVLGSLFIYFLPIVLMVVFSGIAHTFLSSEWVSIVLGLGGFMIGGCLIRYHSAMAKNDPRFHPVLLDESQTISIG